MSDQMELMKESTATCYVVGCGAQSSAKDTEFGVISNHRIGWLTRVVDGELVSFCPTHAYKHHEYLKLVRADHAALEDAKKALIAQWRIDHPIVYDWKAP